MIISLLVASALAFPPGYKVTKTVNDCTLGLGPAENGNVPMHAECHWPEVDIAKVDALMKRWDAHDTIFSAVLASDIVRSQEGWELVKQTHQAKGISNRQTLLWMKRSAVNGGHKYEWYKADDQPLAVASGNVEVTYDSGYWQFEPHPDGGAKVTHHLVYDPGGRVPGFLVRWFQTSGLETTMAEMRKAAQ